MSKTFQGRVKSVLSGDSIVLVSPNHRAKTSPVERIVSLAFIQAPRNDEPFAFDSREYLRNLLIGKIVNVKVINTAPSGREFVDISAPIFESLAVEIVLNGWAKVRERVQEDQAERLQDAQTKAKSEGLGLWNAKTKHIQVIDSIPDSAVEKSKTTPLRAIVERVFSGDRLKLRFLLDKNTHAEVLVHIAGVRAPVSNPFADQAKYYVELFELAKTVTVTVLGELTNGVLIAKINGKSGNLTDRLVKEGLAEVDDRQSIAIGSTGMSHLRELQQTAKAEAKGQWAGILPAKKTVSSNETDDLSVGSKVSATVGRIISADTISIFLANDKEVTVSLTSVRAPRANDPNTSAFVSAARDFVRKKAIGKKVTVMVEAIRPKSDNFDERPLVDMILPNGISLSNSIIESGWATVIRHRRDDTDRSPQWDLFLELEQAAVKAKNGVHGKVPDEGKIIEASENKARASSFLQTFKVKNNISGVVEAVLKYNRFRIFIPRDSLRLTLVLGGLANTSNSETDLSAQALTYVSKRVTQRDIHFTIYNNDNTGAFVSDLFIPGQNTPLQVSLLAHGLAKIHEYSVSQSKFESDFNEAQAKAQKERLGYWKKLDPSQVTEPDEVEQVISSTAELKITPKYHNVKVTSISDDGIIYIRTLDGEFDKFKAFQESLRTFLKTSSAKPSPKNGDIVAAKDSENGLVYRAKVTSHSKGTYTVQHIDYGVLDSIPASSILTLPEKFSVSAYPAQAHPAKLALIHLPPSQPQNYLSEAIDSIYGLTDDTEKLVAIEYRTKPAPNIDYDINLVDFSAIEKGGDKNESINRELVRNGLAIVDRKITSFEKALKGEYDILIELQNEAKRQHIGCWQFGDIEQDEDL